MKRYKLISTNEQSYERTELGVICANSLHEAALFLAYHFPNQYYLASIVELTIGHSDHVLTIPCSDYYASENNGVVPEPLKVAIDMLMAQMKYNNDMYDCINHYVSQDADATCEIWKLLYNNTIVKDNTEEA